MWFLCVRRFEATIILFSKRVSVRCEPLVVVDLLSRLRINRMLVSGLRAQNDAHRTAALGSNVLHICRLCVRRRLSRAYVELEQRRRLPAIGLQFGWRERRQTQLIER